MNPAGEFERYLNLYRLRLKQLIMAHGIATATVTALIVTVVSVALAIRQGFPSDLIIFTRLLLFAGVAFIVYRLIIQPGKAVDADGSDRIEKRTTDFAGRVRTWTSIDPQTHPLAELLAKDSLRVARNHTPEAAIRQREFSLPLAIAGLAGGILLFLAIAGPGNYGYGVRHLWFGWAIPGLLPPQSIEVLPGDDGIRLGGTVRVQAAMQGFDPAEATVHARFDDGEWQQVSMAPVGDQFEFTFFSVREPLEYYVSAANVRSENFEIRVVDVPVVENLTLTYRYPDWTGRQDEVEDPGGDVRAIAETEIAVEIATDRPMTPGELVLGEQTVRLAVDGNTATASFTVAEDDQYFVAATFGGEQIRLTDDYFITVVDDQLPEISFSRPGRDWSASSIEEVTARINATDDYRIESLELRYSVNGGDWTSVELPIEDEQVEIDHVFFLESMGGNQSLVPGDLVSYYAVAEDRGQSASTDMFFIDVQPFDRRYTQSQQSGGQMGGQQQESEISQRQKEIIVSTWNLIREQQEGRRNDPAYVSDNAALLSRVQSTLREQVETLARRTEARQLTASAEEIAQFVEHLNEAAAAMLPAAERLGEIDLDQAILPEQEALRHLLAAEAVFTDINVSLQANNRGGGGQAGRDLSEMFEIEMDLEKNQYETGSRATPEAPQQQMEEAADELEELARRQEQLARNMNRNRQPTPAERWQQEMLRRDVEELRERLERMQQSASNNQPGAEGQSQSEGASGESSGNGEQNPEIERLQRRLDSAVRAMNDADRAMREAGTPEEIERAAAEAGRQLQGARDDAMEAMQAAMQASVESLAERAEEMYRDQREMEDRLQESIRGVNVGTNDSNRLDSGMSILEEFELAEQKRALQTEVQTLEQDARNAASEMADAEPQTAEEIRDAIDKLRDVEVETRIAVAAAYIEQGEAVYIAASESAVTEALRELSEDLDRARDRLGAQSGENGQQGTGGDGVERTLADTRMLRRELQRLAEGARPAGEPSGTGRDDRPDSTGVEVGNLELLREFDQSADNISDDVLSILRDLRGRGVPVQDIDELRRLAADIRASEWTGNPELLEREARVALSRIEQLEIALSRAAEDPVNIRTDIAEEIPEAHREIVADYYRRLGQGTAETEQ